MVVFAIFFALGVWLLQQQAALPDFAWAWLLLGFPVLFSLPLLSPLSRRRDNQRLGCGGLQPGRMASLFTQRVGVRGVEKASNFHHLFARSLRILLLAAFAFGAGFYHAAWQAEQRLAVSLPDEWQGRDIEVIGVGAGLPRPYERGLRFRFYVE